MLLNSRVEMTRAAIAAVMLVAASSNAGTIIRTFDLFDHPGGNVDPQAYGLRLDGFPNGSGNDPTTLSFNSGGTSTMTLDVIDQGGGILDLRIYGTAWGNSALSGTDYGNYNLDFTYAGVTDTGNGWNFTAVELIGTVSANDALASSFMSSPLQLFSKSNGTRSFQFTADGHRIDSDNSTFVGRGWLDPTELQSGWDNRTHDFLFQAVERSIVPMPSAAMLGLAGLGGIAARRRR